jgi:hypothetical protein
MRHATHAGGRAAPTYVKYNPSLQQRRSGANNCLAQQTLLDGKVVVAAAGHLSRCPDADHSTENVSLPKLTTHFPCFCVVLLIITFTVFGTVYVSRPPLELTFDESSAANALCIAVVRTATKVVATLPVGVDGYEMKLLVRFDQLIEPDATRFVRLWTPRALESTSHRCPPSAQSGVSGVTVCEDTALFLQQTQRAPLTRTSARLWFDMVEVPKPWNVLFEPELYDGELLLPLRNQGDTFTVGNTHLCVGIRAVTRPPSPPRNAVQLTYRYSNVSESGRPSPWDATSTISLLSGSAYFSEPSNNPLTECVYNSSILIFPISATDDVYWYGVGEAQTERFRVSNQLPRLADEADRGVHCRASQTDMHYTSLMQCTNSLVCERLPSIPIRRLATALIRFEMLQCAEGGRTCTVMLEADSSLVLQQESFASTGNDNIYRALWKVAAVLLATLAVHVHSDEVNSKGSWIYRECIRLDYWMQLIHTFPLGTEEPLKGDATRPELLEKLSLSLVSDDKLRELCKSPLPFVGCQTALQLLLMYSAIAGVFTIYVIWVRSSLAFGYCVLLVVLCVLCILVLIITPHDFSSHKVWKWMQGVGFEPIEDFTVGGLSAVLRLVVTWNNRELLTADGRGSTYTYAIVGASAAWLFWLTRLFIINIAYSSPVALVAYQHPSTPSSHGHPAHVVAKPALTAMRTLLGGTAAILDANAAMLVTFSSAPVVVYTERFDKIARLMIGGLSAMLTLPRCIWSTSCTALQLTQYCFIKDGHAKVLWITVCVLALVHWFIQAVTLVVTLADLVISPCAILWSRASAGSTAGLSLTILAALYALSMSRTLAQVKLLLQWKRCGMVSIFEKTQ